MIESIKEFINIPFDIIGSVEGDAKFGYAFLLALMLTSVITLTYHILSFGETIYKTTLSFIKDSLDSFTGIFKNFSNKKQTILSMENKIDSLISQKSNFNNTLDDIQNRIVKLEKAEKKRNIL